MNNLDPNLHSLVVKVAQPLQDWVVANILKKLLPQSEDECMPS
jgi:hypothetical protein